MTGPRTSGPGGPISGLGGPLNDRGGPVFRAVCWALTREKGPPKTVRRRLQDVYKTCNGLRGDWQRPGADTRRPPGPAGLTAPRVRTRPLSGSIFYIPARCAQRFRVGLFTRRPGYGTALIGRDHV